MLTETNATDSKIKEVSCILDYTWDRVKDMLINLNKVNLVFLPCVLDRGHREIHWPIYAKPTSKNDHVKKRFELYVAYGIEVDKFDLSDLQQEVWDKCVEERHQTQNRKKSAKERH